jgi:hypothetical protein
MAGSASEKVTCYADFSVSGGPSEKGKRNHSRSRGAVFPNGASGDISAAVKHETRDVA